MVCLPRYHHPTDYVYPKQRLQLWEYIWPLSWKTVIALHCVRGIFCMTWRAEQHTSWKARADTIRMLKATLPQEGQLSGTSHRRKNLSLSYISHLKTNSYLQFDIMAVLPCRDGFICCEHLRSCQKLRGYLTPPLSLNKTLAACVIHNILLLFQEWLTEVGAVSSQQNKSQL